MPLDQDASSHPVRFVLVDNDQQPRTSVKEVLHRARRGYEVVGEACLPEDVEGLIKKLRLEGLTPDVLRLS